MACCAFIVFLASQVYLFASAAVRRLVPMPRTKNASPVAWRLGSVAETPDRHPSSNAAEPSLVAGRRLFAAPRRGRPWLPLITMGVIELAVLVGGVQWFLVGTGRQLLAEDIERLAGIETLGDLKDLCGFERSRGQASP